MSLFADQNYSLYALPICHFLSLYPHFYAVGLIKKATGKWNNVSPRSSEWAAAIQRMVPKDTYLKFERAEAAHKNGMENFPIFAAALILGTVAKLPNKKLNGLAAAYLALRFLYNLVYIHIQGVKRSYIRSLTFMASAGICMSLIWQAANKLRTEV